MYPDIYFACKALNYRTFAEKWDGNKKIGIEVDSPIKKNWSFYYT